MSRHVKLNSNTVSHSLMAQTLICIHTLFGSTKTGGAMWLGHMASGLPLKSFKWPPLKKKALCSKFCNVKMKLPLKGIFWPSFRPKEPVLASQLPFKGIKARGFFVDTAAVTVTWPARVSHEACQAPPPCFTEGHEGKFGCVPSGLGRPTKDRRQAMASLAMGWVRQHRPLFWPVCATKKPPPCLMPLNGNCEASTGSFGLKLGQNIPLSGNFILAVSE